MNHQINHSVGGAKLMLAVSLLVFAFVLAQPGEVAAQTQNPVTTLVPPGGTINKIPKWTAGTALGDSVITESASGNIGIGTASPQALLHVWGLNSSAYVAHGIPTVGPRITNADTTANNAATIRFSTVDTNSIEQSVAAITSIFTNHTPGAVTGDLVFQVKNSGIVGEAMRIASSSNVGIGTTSPSAKLHVVGDLTLTGSGNLVNSGNITATGTISGGSAGIGTTSTGAYKLKVVGSANVTENLIVDGNIAAKYQDVAEWVPASRAIAAGTVVVLDAERSNHVLPSSRAYDTRVAGVISANPGVLLGEGGKGKVIVATTGRVKLKVDATRAPIRVGDLLVTSDKEGIAMRSQPLDLGGTPIHRPGTLIGKALEPLEKGVGEILVLLSLQ